MYGAIIGDIVGSIYEYDEFIDSQNKNINLKRRLNCLKENLLCDKCFYSDDTILTIAILDSILNNISYEINLKKYGLDNMNNTPKNIKYFKYMFSPGFKKWCENNKQGLSNGNGCIMRISSIGYLFNNINDIIKESTLATIPSHNNELSITSANIVAEMIYMFRKNKTKKEVFEYIENKYKINTNYNIEELQKKNIFDGTCNVLGKLLYILKISSSFEDSIRLTLSIGGDTDTNACIVGSIAESVYGIEEYHIEKIKQFLPDEYNTLLKKGYTKIKKYK